MAELGKNLSDDKVKAACHLAFKAHKSHDKAFLEEKRGSDVIIFAFAGSWSADEWFTAAGGQAFGETKIDLEQFHCLRSISNDELAKVNQAFLLKFLEIKSTLETKVMNTLNDGKRQIIFTGHSAGGPLAIFATTWLFEHLRSKRRVQPSSTTHNCLTFGSPLSTDHIFCHAVRREDWSDHFVHFVMRHDIVPRIPLAPPSSTMGGALHEILSVFNPNAQNLPDVNSMLASEFFVNLMRHASCAATHAACTLMGSASMLRDTISGFIELSPYRPFGTFLFCSTNGRLLVVKNPDAVLQILFYSLQLKSEMEVPDAAKTSLSAHMAYKDEINKNLGRQGVVCLDTSVEIPLNSGDSMDPHIILTDETLNDFGLSARARLCLRAATESEKQKVANLSKIEQNKKIMKDAMTKLENYRFACEARGGYYDSFRKNQCIEDFQANVKRLELAGVWDEIVEMLKRYELPEKFEGQKEWVDLGTEYRRFVEPLDIANYYRHLKNEDTGPYLERGRPRRYRYTQRWLEQFGQKPSGSCGESTFWADLEELRMKTSNREPFAALKPKIDEMEKNLKRWLSEGTVKRDAFLEGSTLVKVWAELHRLNPAQVQDITGFISSSSSSEL
ncbi:hypothetical protein SAY86_024639 [Trapa natans]|uniref:Protein EDS1L-like n=1 Tax=Trapa natans TaxID=22666 RepID=A0AAN7M718_TRANT|nr:hypothetical protein SAY86_024639 [Trapa natans]